MLQNEEMTAKYFKLAEDILGDTKEENIKYARMLYIQGLATQKFSQEKATEIYSQSILFFINLLNQDDGFYVS